MLRGLIRLKRWLGIKKRASSNLLGIAQVVMLEGIGGESGIGARRAIALTLTLSQRERGLTVVFAENTST